MKAIIYFIVLVLITSCGSNNFTKRKFTKGVYVAKRGHVKKTKPQKSDLDLNYKVSHLKGEDVRVDLFDDKEVETGIVQDEITFDDEFSGKEVEEMEVEISRVRMTPDSTKSKKSVVYPKEGEQKVVDNISDGAKWVGVSGAILAGILLLFFILLITVKSFGLGFPFLMIIGLISILLLTALGLFIDSEIQQNRLDYPERKRKVKLMSISNIKSNSNLALLTSILAYTFLALGVGLMFVNIGFIFLIPLSVPFAIASIVLSNKIRKNSMTNKKAQISYLISMLFIVLLIILLIVFFLF